MFATMRHLPKSNTNRALIAAGLVAIGMLLGWLGYETIYGGGLGFTTCRIPKKDYRVAKLFDSNGELEMTFYAFRLVS